MKPRQYAMLGAALVLFAALAGGLTVRREHEARPAGAAQGARSFFRVEYGGEPIGYVADEAHVQEAVNVLLDGLPQEGKALADPRPRLVTHAVVPPAGVTAMSVPDLVEALRALVPGVRRAWVLQVDGRDVVALSSPAEAEQVLADIRSRYLETVLRDASRVDQIRFAESIRIEEKWVPESMLRTPEQAAEILRYGTDRRIFHTVSRGETLWGIARSRGMSVEDLMAANPGVDPERLQPGQQVSVTVREPYIHIESTEVRVYEESIPFTEEVTRDPELWPWEKRVIEPGRPGKREVTVRIHRRDGQVVGREVLSTRLLEEPRRQLVAKGTRTAPRLGTGRFILPVQGQLTSRFGPRGRDWHKGVDIAAPPGTPVRAADSGTVTYVGWDGPYGLLVRIDHGGGDVETVYAHLSSASVKAGDGVQKGQVIGQVGRTGNATGPHLHYEIRIGGRPVDPLQFYR